jgi:hypothetical protein
MSNPRISNGNANGLTPTPPIANEQLETPALTPISEHEAFPTYDDTSDYDISNGRPNGQHEVNGYGTASRKSSAPPSPRTMSGETPKMFKLSPSQIEDLTSSPGSIPMRPAPQDDDISPLHNGLGLSLPGGLEAVLEDARAIEPISNGKMRMSSTESATMKSTIGVRSINATSGAVVTARPGKPSRSASSPAITRKPSSSRMPKPAPLKLESTSREASSASVKISPNPEASQPSPMPPIIPIPPLSLPTYLQLELSSDRPSPLYIHRSASSDFPYESSKVKHERLMNFLRLPPLLEQVLIFGALACLDSWLFTFTILPLRFLKATWILIRSWARNMAKEARDLSAFVYDGIGRLWQRRQTGPESRRSSAVEQPSSRRPSESNGTIDTSARPTLKLDTASTLPKDKSRKRTGFRHRRTRSTPSALQPNHKADLLQGECESRCTTQFFIESINLC